MYEDYYHGQFSKKLAEWAISQMKVKDPTSNKMVAIKPTTLEETKGIFKESGIKIDDKMQYTAWYLYNMARADYAKSLTSDATRAIFIDETINDPDCCPEAVLECFTAKMCIMEVPIYWEEML